MLAVAVASLQCQVLSQADEDDLLSTHCADDVLSRAHLCKKFERLIAPHLGAGHRLARWLVRDPALADDVVQDACIRAWRHLGALRSECGKSWFLQIVRNAAYATLRKARARAKTAFGAAEACDDDPLALGFADPGPAPDVALAIREEFALLNRKVADLPDDLRECVILRYDDELAYREIAQVANLPIGTVMSRLHRARSKLADTWGERAAA